MNAELYPLYVGADDHFILYIRHLSMLALYGLQKSGYFSSQTEDLFFWYPL